MSDPKHVRLLTAGLTLACNLVANFFTPPQAQQADRPKAKVINLQARRAVTKSTKSCNTRTKS